MPTKARRGYRSILVYIPTAQYAVLEGIAAENFRSIEQQASAMLTGNLKDMESYALEAVKRNEVALSRGEVNGSIDAEIEERAAWSDPESVEVAPAE